MVRQYIQIGIIVVLVVLIAVLVINNGSKFSISNTTRRMGTDGLTYRVHRLHTPEIDEPGVNYGSSEYILSILNNKAIELLKHLKYSKNVNSTHTMIKRLLKYYNPDNLVENSPKNIAGDTSFTYNDGSTLALCLRDTKKGYNPHDINTLTFVFIHEIAHISIPESGHPPKFWDAFRRLLLDSNAIGIIELVNYAQNPVKYCGMTINSNPIF
jgi:hypothetical protein